MHSMRAMEMWNTVQQIFDKTYCCNQVAADIARTLRARAHTYTPVQGSGLAEANQTTMNI